MHEIDALVIAIIGASIALVSPAAGGVTIVALGLVTGLVDIRRAGLQENT